MQINPKVNLPETGFVRLPVVLSVFPFCRSTLYSKLKNGTFPAPVKLGPRIVAWRVEDILELIESLSGKD